MPIFIKTDKVRTYGPVDEIAQLALDAISEVQGHVDAESVGEEELAELWERWGRLVQTSDRTVIPHKAP